MTAMIRARGLSRHFGATVALHNVEVEVGPGECLGVSGPPGSGRTTLLRILAALLPPTSGSVEIGGLDVVQHVYTVRRRVTYVGQEPPTPLPLRTRDHLRCVHQARQGARPSSKSVDAALTRADVPVDALTDHLSVECRRRLDLATALSAAPDVLLLDDPFRSLDAPATQRFVGWISEVRAAGCSIVVTGNDRSWLELLCQSIIELEQGRVAPQFGMHHATAPVHAPSGLHAGH
jgi:ABC-type multidrug transport system ATPase subunit